MADSQIAVSNSEGMWNSIQSRSRYEAMAQELSHHLGEQVQCALAMYTETSQDKQNSSKTSSCYIIIPEIKVPGRSSIFFLMESKVLLPFCHTLFRTPQRIFFVVVCFAFRSTVLLTSLVAAHQRAQEGCFGRAIKEEVNGAMVIELYEPCVQVISLKLGD